MTEYSERIKAQALAALLAGQTFAEVARAFQVPIGTLKSWKQRSGVSSASLVDAVDASDKKARIGALLLDYLVTTIETLTAQQVVFADVDWLKTQSAGELAILHGVSVDKAVRLLEALTDDDPAAPDTGGVH
jgi:hypothetical protein